jgi:hypothetical protein
MVAVDTGLMVAALIVLNLVMVLVALIVVHGLEILNERRKRRRQR